MKKNFLRAILRKLGFSIREARQEIERFYERPDPWGYKTNPDDQIRKQRILNILNKFLNKLGEKRFRRALDVGCGEGWITEDLPAEEIIGVDISSKAIGRVQKSGRKATYYQLDINKDSLPNNFDLIVATGVLYKDYIKPEIIKNIEEALNPKGILLTCHIKEWKIYEPNLPSIYQEEFPYREYRERLILYQKSYA